MNLNVKATLISLSTLCYWVYPKYCLNYKCENCPVCDACEFLVELKNILEESIDI